MSLQKRKKEQTDQPSGNVDVKCVSCGKQLQYLSLKQHYWMHGMSYSYPNVPYLTIEDKSHCVWAGPADKRRKISNISELKSDSFTQAKRGAVILNSMQGAQHIFSMNNLSNTTNKCSYDINATINATTSLPLYKPQNNIKVNAFADENYAKSKPNSSSSVIVSPIPQSSSETKHKMSNQNVICGIEQNSNVEHGIGYDIVTENFFDISFIAK